MSDFELPTKKTSDWMPETEEKAPGPAPATDKKPPEFSKDELLKVFDDLIFSGEYHETFRIRDKFTVTLRTRTAEETDKIQMVVDGSNLKLISSVETLRSILHLRYALVFCGKTDMAVMPIDQKAKFIDSLPGPIVGKLLELLSKFDYKVSKAFEEGEENF